jgi:hypothetical protein
MELPETIVNTDITEEQMSLHFILQLFLFLIISKIAKIIILLF